MIAIAMSSSTSIKAHRQAVHSFMLSLSQAVIQPCALLLPMVTRNRGGECVKARNSPSSTSRPLTETFHRRQNAGVLGTQPEHLLVSRPRVIK
jgi:hypothetical protein